MATNMRGNSQAGFVSILTVLLFMVLTSIVTVSFIRMVTLEQQQSLNDDLSKGAYDAAQAGVQDAKRAIRYCQSDAAPAGSCTGLYETSCPGFFADSSIEAGLGLDIRNDAVQVGDTSANQRYTCVTIGSETKEYIGELNPQSTTKQSIFLPLDSSSNFNQARISWAMKKENTALAIPATSAVSGINPRTTGADGTAWDSAWPAAMRAMVVSHPSSFTLDQVASRSAFWFPASAGAGNTQNAHGMLSRDLVSCSSSIASGEYACTVTLTGLDNARKWYLQLAPQYVPTDFKIELFNGSNRVPMRGFGYVIDATGAAGDVYRRVQVTLGPSDVVSSNSALQTGGLLCKNFSVTGYYPGQNDRGVVDCEID